MRCEKYPVCGMNVFVQVVDWENGKILTTGGQWADIWKL